MKKRRGLLLVLLACFGSGKAFTQIVNMESQRYHTDTTGWSGAISGDFALTNYGERVVALNATAHVQYQTPESLYLLLGSYGFLKGSQLSFIDYGFLHLRYNYKLSKLVRAEVFTQLQQNAITKIDSRFLLGAGPRLKLAGSKQVHLYVATLVMYEAERETGKAKQIRDCRSSNYLSFTYVPNNQTEIISTTYYQPVLFNAGDYRLLNQSVFKIKASKKIAVLLNWSYQFDASPAQGVQRNTYVFSTGLELNL